MMDEELLIGNKSWNRMSQALFQEGFREGAEIGKEETLQQAFNVGFNEGLANNFPLGEVEGIMKVLAFKKISGTEHLLASNKQDSKDCIICQRPEIESSGISHIIEEQSIASKALLQSKLDHPVKEVLSKLHLQVFSDTSSKS